MRIVINHLTRMQKGYVCASGYDPEAEKHVRPLLPGRDNRLTTGFLALHGGPFDIGAIVDLGSPRCIGQPPELEDHRIQTTSLKSAGAMTPDGFWAMLTHVARKSLRAIFGNDLVIIGDKSAGVDVHRGHASLGCLIPHNLPFLFLMAGRTGPRVRIIVKDDDFDLDLGVTDIRLYREDHVTPDPEAVRRAAIELCKCPCVLSVGLTRQYQNATMTKPMHWLQVNNIHLLSNPVWTLRKDTRP